MDSYHSSSQLVEADIASWCDDIKRPKVPLSSKLPQRVRGKREPGRETDASEVPPRIKILAYGAHGAPSRPAGAACELADYLRLRLSFEHRIRLD